MPFSQLSIVGAGLIGGSIAHAAKARALARTIVAIEKSPAPAADTPFDAWISADDEAAVALALARSDLTVLCVPVGAIIDFLPFVLEHTRGLVTDCGSTKAAILRSLKSHPARERYVPGHPMAGHPEGGLKNARSDLYEGRTWILCPEGGSPTAVESVKAFVAELGAIPLLLDAQRHDRSVAITSHVPQVVASALAVFAQEENAKEAAGPGFASATRVAGGAEEMWRDIFGTNGEAIGAALKDVGKKLQTLGDELGRGDLTGALQTLESARKLRGNPP